MIHRKPRHRFLHFSLGGLSDELKADFLRHQWVHNRRFLGIASALGVLGGASECFRRILLPHSLIDLDLDHQIMMAFALVSLLSMVLFGLTHHWRHRKAPTNWTRFIFRLYVAIMMTLLGIITAIQLQDSFDLTASLAALTLLSVTVWFGMRMFLSLIVLHNVVVFQAFTLGLSPRVHPGEFLIAQLLFTAIAVVLYIAVNDVRLRSFRYERTLRSTIQELQDLSVRDHLTQLYNRRMMNEDLERELARSLRSEDNMAVALLDIDRFKAVNDNLGHTVGDDVLKEAAHLIQEGIRSADRVYRFGGEEFLILFPETQKDVALGIAERLRGILSETAFPGVPWSVTVSMGLADISERQDTAELIKLADERLYLAKKNGRNRCVWLDHSEESA
ncbi:MAG: GGDEF domain-containing protein [Spirochaetales bacterium]|nr:GGDEF domain-containing protein [Spirochaetales bacterium]